MKYTVVLLALLCSSCVNLSKQNHLSIDDASASISDSFCGYASFEWKKFGTGNLAQVTNDDIGVSFCSTAHYSKIVAKGFIFPFIPTDGREHTFQRWIQINNTHPVNELVIKEDFFSTAGVPANANFCKDQSRSNRCPYLRDIEERLVQIKPGESVWVSLPERDALTVKIYSGAKGFEFKLIEVDSRSWWMLTV